LRRSLGRLRDIPASWRWTALGTAALIAAVLVWYFFLRSTPGAAPSAATPPARPALGQTLAYDQYSAAVDGALSAVREAASLEGAERTRKLEDAAAALEKVEGARVAPRGAGSAAAEVDNTAIIAELRGKDPNLEAIETSLSALSGSLHGEAQAGSGILDGESALAELREVLRDPVFDYERELSPLQRFARWLSQLTGDADPNDILWRLVTSLVAAIASGTLTYLASERLGGRLLRLGLSVVTGLTVGAMFYTGTADLSLSIQALGAVGLVVAAIAAALIFSGVYRASAPSRPRVVSELAAALGMSADEARKRAEEAAASGDYRLAIRYRCLAVLLALDEVGKLAFDRAATDREYLFRAPGPLQDDLQALLTRFEEVWYGDAPAEAAGWQEYAGRAARIEAQVASEVRAEKAGTAGLRRSAV
jgi:hypothetical protein